MLAGNVAIYAASKGDLRLYRLVGLYMLAISAVGIIAIPASPFLAGALISGLMVAAGYERI
jgi:hypothetical protein